MLGVPCGNKDGAEKAGKSKQGKKETNVRFEAAIPIVSSPGTIMHARHRGAQVVIGRLLRGSPSGLATHHIAARIANR